MQKHKSQVPLGSEITLDLMLSVYILRHMQKNDIKLFLIKVKFRYKWLQLHTSVFLHLISTLQIVDLIYTVLENQASLKFQISYLIHHVIC